MKRSWPSEQLDKPGAQCYSGTIQEDLRGRVQIPTGGDALEAGDWGLETSGWF